MSSRPLLAVIPARGGSKGLPGKALRPLAGLPLIAHSIRCAALCPEIDRTLVTTDCSHIAAVARDHGGDVPFLRPAQLAADDTPMLDVLQHALRVTERRDERRYESVLLLDPTSPARLPAEISEAVRRLAANEEADGIVGVSRPSFNPLWHCVVEQGGYMAPLIPGAARYHRRQDVPDVYRINATLYLWRRDFLLGTRNWMGGKLLLLEVPELRAIHIDDPDELRLADLLLRKGLVRLPWLESA